MMPAVWARVCGALLQLAARANRGREAGPEDEESISRRQRLRRFAEFCKASGRVDTDTYGRSLRVHLLSF
jgi:hypothetical protein